MAHPDEPPHAGGHRDDHPHEPPHPSRARPAPPATSPLSQPRLPRWAAWLVAALSAAAAALISLSLDWNVVGGTVLAVVLFAVALPTWSRLVENSRAANDRLVTTLVWSAFARGDGAAGLADDHGDHERHPA